MPSFFAKNRKTKINTELVEEMYRRYYGLLFHEASKMLYCRDLAKDIVHDTIEKMMRIIDDIDGGNIASEKFKNTAVIIVKNACIDEIRKQKRINEIVVDIADDELERTNYYGSVEEIVISAETIELIIKAIDSLDIKYSSVLKLRYFSDMTFEEISVILDITPESARKRLERAKKLLIDCCIKGGIVVGK